MLRLPVAVMTITLLGPAVAAPQATHPRNAKTPGLSKAHKQQRRALKQQQRAMKKVMGQHEVSSDERRRFKHEMKAERRTLRKEQKSESRSIKETRKSARPGHTMVPKHLP
jgi:hypothetical protein